jgi:type II secretory pathway pseudopilin PulG
MSLNPYESPDTVGKPPPLKPRGLRSTLLSLLAVVGILAILVALLLPAVRVAREPARRSQCSNNLKQIGLALHMYRDEHGSLPPAYTVDADGKPLHSWRTLILPYLEHQTLYDKIDLSKPWDDPVNKAAFEAQIVPAYHCPSLDIPRQLTTYLAVVAPGGCFRPTETRAFEEITDDRGLTLMVVEVDAEHAVPWMSPSDANEELILSLGEAARPPHSSGGQAACVDGSVRSLPLSLKAETRRALISIDGADDAAAKKAAD